MNISGYRVEDVTVVGEADNGRSIHFTLLLQGGPPLTLLVNHTLVTKLQIGIQSAASMAAKERVKQLGSHKAADEAYGVAPVPITYVQPALVWDDQKKKYEVLVQLRGADEVSMSLSMDPGLAGELAERLQEAALEAARQPPPTTN